VVGELAVSATSEPKETLRTMLHAGLDLSRKRLDYCLLDVDGERVETGAVARDADARAGLVGLIELRHGPGLVCAAIGVDERRAVRARHAGALRLGVQIADAHEVKGLAPLACKTDRIEAWVLAELSRRDLVPAIWLPSFGQRQARERARWRLHLVKHRIALKQRVSCVRELRRFGFGNRT
jgi:transposase